MSTEADLTETIAPNSDQLNADDLVAGSKTFTITDVSKGDPEQPIFIHLAEIPGRTYRPSKSMRRVLVAAWGGKGSTYVGRRLTLYRDPEVRFGRDKVGGIKISHLSHIDNRMSLALTVTRGKKAAHTVDPLPDAPTAPTEPTEEDVAACTDREALRAMYRISGEERRVQIKARVEELDAAPEPTTESD